MALPVLTLDEAKEIAAQASREFRRRLGKRWDPRNNRWLGTAHSHRRENTRRRLQIAAKLLKP